MLRLILRKLGTSIVFLIVLNALSYWFATVYEPQVRNDPETAVTQGFWSRYAIYLQGLLRGDWGTVQGVPIAEYIGPLFQRSLIILTFALVWTVIFGPLLGLFAISRRTTRITSGAYGVLAVGSSLPGFFLGSLLIAGLIYLSRSGWYTGPGTLIPVQGFGVDAHIILPVFTLAARPTFYVGYIVAGLLEHELQQDYIRVARGKGLPWRDVLMRHALPAIAGGVTVSLHRGLHMLIGGLIVVEALFDWRGVGYLFLYSLRSGQGSAMPVPELQPELLAVLAVIFGGMLLLSDVITSLIVYVADQRVRAGEMQPAIA